MILGIESIGLSLAAGVLSTLSPCVLPILPILRSRGMSVVPTNQPGLQGMLRMNHLHPPFDQPEARQALLYLVDQEEHMRAMFSDPSLWRTCHAFFVCGSPLETDAGVDARFGKDPEKAKRLFAEAGYAGQPLVIMHPTDVGTMNAATLVLADELKRIGIKVALQAMDFAAMAQRRANKKPPAEGGWNIGFTYWNGLGAPIRSAMRRCRRAVTRPGQAGPATPSTRRSSTRSPWHRSWRSGGPSQRRFSGAPIVLCLTFRLGSGLRRSPTALASRACSRFPRL